MKDNNHAIVAENTKKSLQTHRRTFLRRLGRDVVPQSSTQPEPPSSEKSILILMSILQGITENTTSGDVIELGVYRAKDICQRHGINEDEFEKVVKQYMEFSVQVRKWNPLAF